MSGNKTTFLDEVVEGAMRLRDKWDSLFRRLGRQTAHEPYVPLLEDHLSELKRQHVRTPSVRKTSLIGKGVDARVWRGEFGGIPPGHPSVAATKEFDLSALYGLWAKAHEAGRTASGHAVLYMENMRSAGDAGEVLRIFKMGQRAVAPLSGEANGKRKAYEQELARTCAKIGLLFGPSLDASLLNVVAAPLAYTIAQLPDPETAGGTLETGSGEYLRFTLKLDGTIRQSASESPIEVVPANGAVQQRFTVLQDLFQTTLDDKLNRLYRGFFYKSIGQKEFEQSYALLLYGVTRLAQARLSAGYLDRDFKPENVVVAEEDPARTGLFRGAKKVLRVGLIDQSEWRPAPSLDARLTPHEREELFPQDDPRFLPALTPLYGASRRLAYGVSLIRREEPAAEHADVLPTDDSSSIPLMFLNSLSLYRGLTERIAQRGNSTLAQYEEILASRDSYVSGRHLRELPGRLQSLRSLFAEGIRSGRAGEGMEFDAFASRVYAACDEILEGAISNGNCGYKHGRVVLLDR